VTPPDDTIPVRTYSRDPALLSLALPDRIVASIDYSDTEGIEAAGEFAQRFPVAAHPAAGTTHARSILTRLHGDEVLYTRAVRERKTRGAPALVGLGPARVEAVLADPAKLRQVSAGVADLLAQVSALQRDDLERGAQTIDAAIALADNTMLGCVSELASGVFPVQHALAQAGGCAPRATLESLVALLMTPALKEQVQLLNPLLDSPDAAHVEEELVTGLLLTCRGTCPSIAMRTSPAFCTSLAICISVPILNMGD